MWFTETPWPPIVILAAIAAVLVGLWANSHRAAPLIGVVLLFFMAVGIYFVEQSIVTERERVEARLGDLVEAAKGGDVDAVLAFLSPQEQMLRQLIRGALRLVDIEDDVRITDLNTAMRTQNTLAITRFRANGTISVGSQSVRHHAYSMWEVTWQKSRGQWIVVAIKRLDPMDGSERGLLDPRE